MTRTVLVTGAGGFVGSHVVEAIVASTDWHVVATDSFRHNGEFERLLETGAMGPRVVPLVHDLSVPFTNRMLRRLVGVNYVVNVASRCHVGQSIAEPEAYIANNTHLMLNVLEVCRQLNIQYLIQMSTDEVYGPHEPTSPTDHRPSSPYAASKAIQEDCIHAYARTYNVNSTIVTSANMIGERQSSLAYVPGIVRSLVRGLPVGIHTSNGEYGVRNYTYVRNVAVEIVDRLIAFDRDPQTIPQPLDRLALPGQVTYTNMEIAQRVSELADIPLYHHILNGDTIRPGYDPSYQRIGDNWNPRVSFDDGLKVTVDWAKNHFKIE